ncbi:autotransporter assembly complex protein TamA [Marinicella meishanensis]|uniref:autotransporter assembly complex protein TamA n=1 Tax=Marinicella meishanensis TaxID=2873263 RepID=UPI001CBB3695|nr:outer membrane protein assembly factor [Marinicella sp. NBU2979]
MMGLRFFTPAVVLLMLLCPAQLVAIEWQVPGLEAEQAQNVRLFLANKNFNCQSLRIPNSQQQQALKQQVRLALQPFGYFNARTQLLEAKAADKDCESITLQVDLGPVTRITQVNIEVTGAGAEDAAFVAALKAHGLQRGAPLRQPEYAKLKRQLTNLASERFYLDAQFIAQQMRVQAENNEAAVELSFHTGERYRLRSVIISEEPSHLSPEWLQRLVPFKTGAHISRDDLYRLKQKLNATGYFAQVKFDTQIDEWLGAQFDLHIKLTPAAKFDYAVGLGFSTDAGIKTSFKYNNHRVNSRGHQYALQVQASELNRELSMNYQMPSSRRPGSKWYSVHLGYKDEETSQVSSELSKLGFSETRIHDNRWQNINFIDWVQESFDTGVNRNTTQLVVPGTSWSVTEADDLSRPFSGYQLQAELKLASDDLLSDASFAQLTFNGKWIHRVGTSSRLLYRLQLGSTASSDFDVLPTNYRFYAGGDQSIRGFDYETIAPVDGNGDLVGGKHMFTGSVEYEYPIAAQWAAAVFTDFGDAFTDEFDFQQAVGLGLRWFSPIGPIRLDLAKPLDRQPDSIRLHITVGPDL